MSLPMAEAAPESGESRPILIGPLWAGAGWGAPSVRARRRIAAKASRRWAMTVSPLAAAAPHRAHKSLRREENDANVDGSQDEEPAFRVDADKVLEEHDNSRANRRPHERARTTQRHHEQRLHRGDELDVGGTDEAVVIRPEYAGHAGKGAGDHEGDVLVQPHIVAERPHARLAAPDAFEAEPERRADEQPEQQPDQRGHRQRKVEERQRRGEVER